MRITLAQLNYRVGDFEGNVSLMNKAVSKARDEGSDLVIFSELCITGYPPLDLLENLKFLKEADKALHHVAAGCRGIAAIVGAPVINTSPEGKKLFNVAMVLSEGRIIFTARKALLPTYDIFDEYRYFEPGREFGIFEFRNKRIAVTVCEDLWDEQPDENYFGKSRLYTVSPADELAKLKPELIINISASPFSYTRTTVRQEIFKGKALKHGIPVVMVNQTGANTELIFDGGSMAVKKDGTILHQLPFFEESIFTFDLDELTSGGRSREIPIPDHTELIYKALLTGIRDYFGKSGFKKAVLGLSGGIDSAVVLCLAAEALGNENVTALLLPSRYSSKESVDDAVMLARNTGVNYNIISIEQPFTAFEEVLKPVFSGRQADVTEENIQARIRAVILMAWSNKFGHILLNTSNKSEAAVGYGTLYGDMAGGLSVIGDVYKTDVYRIAAFINRNKEIIPPQII
ncbi:MAG: NAD+ synthase, partial [Bacteroidales bacterium]|nr:NAD+ synthase [Bacteroidales bacterium]